MGIHFEKPPLVEAICAFHFAEKSWDEEIAARFSKRWGERFPLVIEPQNEDDPLRFGSEDTTRTIEMTPAFLSVRFGTSYGHWGEFKALILEVLESYVSLTRSASLEHLQRVVLHYANSIATPAPEPFEDFIYLVPRSPEGMDTNEERKYVHVIERSMMEMRDLNGIFQFIMGIQGGKSIELRLQFDTFPDSQVSLLNVGEWLDGAHGEILRIFLANITPKARQIFGETESP